MSSTFKKIPCICDNMNYQQRRLTKLCTSFESVWVSFETKIRSSYFLLPVKLSPMWSGSRSCLIDFLYRYSPNKIFYAKKAKFSLHIKNTSKTAPDSNALQIQYKPTLSKESRIFVSHFSYNLISVKFFISSSCRLDGLLSSVISISSSHKNQTL